MKALELENIYCRQGDFLLQDISLSLEVGDVVAITGRSGAGKTTLIKAIGNAVDADAGIIKYYGRQMYEDEKNIRRMLSVMYDKPNFNMEMRCSRLVKEIKRFEADFSTEDFYNYMKILNLDTDKRGRLFSSGMKKKYMLAILLARNPKLLVMDEVTSGVDAESREIIWKLLQDYKKKNELTILFSTHHMKDIELIGARELILDNGGLA